jgi:hypothetical protein
MKFTQHTPDLSTPPTAWERRIDAALDILAAVIIGCLLAIGVAFWGML